MLEASLDRSQHAFARLVKVFALLNIFRLSSSATVVRRRENVTTQHDIGNNQALAKTSLRPSETASHGQHDASKLASIATGSRDQRQRIERDEETGGLSFMQRTSTGDHSGDSSRDYGIHSGLESGIYGNGMDDALRRFIATSQEMSESNLRDLNITTIENDGLGTDLDPLKPATTPAPIQTVDDRMAALENGMKNAIEVAKVAEAAASKATGLLISEDSQIKNANDKINMLETRNQFLLDVLQAIDHSATNVSEDVRRLKEKQAKEELHFANATKAASDFISHQLDGVSRAESVASTLGKLETKVNATLQQANDALKQAKQTKNLALSTESSVDALGEATSRLTAHFETLEKDHNRTKQTVARLANRERAIAAAARNSIFGAASAASRNAAANLTGPPGPPGAPGAPGASGPPGPLGTQPVARASPIDSGLKQDVEESTDQANAAIQAVSRMRARSNWPVYMVASQTGDLLEIAKGQAGAAGPAGMEGPDGLEGKEGSEGEEGLPGPRGDVSEVKKTASAPQAVYAFTSIVSIISFIAIYSSVNSALATKLGSNSAEGGSPQAASPSGSARPSLLPGSAPASLPPGSPAPSLPPSRRASAAVPA